MKSSQGAQPTRAVGAGSVALLAATGAAGLWLWPTHGAFEPFWSVVGLLALSAALGGVWLYRLRAARRLFSALDAYAEQELARAENRPSTSSNKSNRGFSRSSV